MNLRRRTAQLLVVLGILLSLAVPGVCVHTHAAPPETLTRFPLTKKELAAIRRRLLAAGACDASWLSGSDGFWHDAGNWSSLPIPADDVCISVPRDVTVTHSQNSTSIASLMSDEDLVVSGGTFTVTGTADGTSLVLNGATATFNGATTFDALELISGTLGVGSVGDVTVQDLYWETASLAGTGTIVVEGAGMIVGGVGYSHGNRHIDDGHTLNINANSIVNTAIVSSQPAMVFLGPSSQVNIASGVTLDWQTNGHFYGNGCINNVGTLRRSTGTGTVNFECCVNNNGTIDVDEGTLRLSGGGTTSEAPGFLCIEAGAALHYANGLFTSARPVMVIGGGTLGVVGANVSFAEMVAGLDATLRVSDGTATFNGARTAFESLQMLGGNSGTMTVASGADVTVQGFDWERGTLAGPGRTVVEGEGMAVSGSSYIVGLRFIGDGHTLDLAADSTVSPVVSPGQAALTFLGSGGQVNIASGVTLDWQTDGHFNGINGCVNNFGTLRRSVGMGEVHFECPLNNDGTLDVHSGCLRMQRGGISASPQTLNVLAGGVLDYFGGTFDSPFPVTITGSGTVGFSGDAMATFAGAVTAANATVQISDGTAIFQGTGNMLNMLELSGGTLGTMQVDAGADVTAQSFLWETGYLKGAGTTVIAGSGMTVSGVGQIDLGHTLNINANSVVSTTNNVAMAFIDANSQINIASGVSFDWQTNGNFNSNGSCINNFGTLCRSAGTAEAIFEGPIHSTGTIDVQTGTMRAQGGGTSTGQLTIGATGIFHVHNAPFSLANSSQTTITVNGSDPGIGHGQIKVNDQLTLAGDLTILDGGSAPSGTTFTVVDASTGTIAGAFANINVPSGWGPPIVTGTLIQVTSP